jgi:hypothetical protein
VVSREQKLAEAKRKAPKAMDTCPSCTCVAGEKILVSSKYFLSDLSMLIWIMKSSSLHAQILQASYQDSTLNTRSVSTENYNALCYSSPKKIQDKISHLSGFPAADIVNTLEIKGKLLSAIRGKELVLAIGQVSHLCFRDTGKTSDHIIAVHNMHMFRTRGSWSVDSYIPL